MSIGSSVSSTLRQIFSRRRPRCAVIEFNYYHGETMPTIVRALNILGVAVEVYCPPRLSDNNPFVYTRGLHYQLQDSELLSEGELAEHLREFDLVIVNSLEPRENLDRIKHLSHPIIGVMHNASLMTSDPDYAEFFSSPRHKALVMASHIADFMSNPTSIQWISPVELGKVRRDTTNAHSLTTFCVQGNLHGDRRNYRALFDAVSSMRARGFQNFRVLMIGRNDTADGYALRRDIQAGGLDQFFEFSEGELRYIDYYGSIARADFLLPLVDPNSTDHLSYFRDKLSTSMQIALAFQVVPIVHIDLARLYRVESESFTYSTNLQKTMLTALIASEEELLPMRNGLSRVRDELLRQSTDNLKILLNELKIGESRKPDSSPLTDRECHAHPHN